MSKQVDLLSSDDGVDRRGFLKCMAWAGTGLLWTMQGGIPTSRLLGAESVRAAGGFSFVQVSDSHIGFSKEVNKDVTRTFQIAVDRINTGPTAPSLVLHTGDLTHLSKATEFDTVEQIMHGVKTDRTLYIPGEHDFFVDDGKMYLERFGKGTKGMGWSSTDDHGVHFIGLVNVANLKPGGLGQLGREQLEWLEKDVASLGSSTPIVVYAHVPLWSVYPKWGWGTEDGATALSMLKRFANVTVLNGHIHQILQKVEGNVTFHTARSTAFPQPEPGKAESPGPLKNVPAGKLKSMLGLTRVSYVARAGSLAIADLTLE